MAQRLRQILCDHAFGNGEPPGDLAVGKPVAAAHQQRGARLFVKLHQRPDQRTEPLPVDEDGFLYTDSDTAFLRPFDCNSLWHGDKLRLFVRPDALIQPKWPEHPVWSANAAKLLNIKNGKSALNDYVGQLVSWRRDSVLSMCERIEAVSGLHWVAALGNIRRFSECFIYGRYVDDVLHDAGHYTDTHDLCRMQWFAPPPSEEEFRMFIADMEPHQVAIGMQSFLGLSVDDIRRIIGA